MNITNRVRTNMLATVALGALMLAAPAHAAGYNVTTYDTVDAGTIYVAGGASCSYNHGSTGGVCSHGTATYGGAAAGSINPTGGDGKATLVRATVSGAGAGATAIATSTADLSSASLHLYGSDSSVTSNCSSGVYPCGYSQAYADIQDTLHFSVAGASANTVTTITGTFTLEGSMIHTGATVDSPDSGYAEIYGALEFGVTPSRFDLFNDASSGFVTQVNYLDNYPSGISPSTWTTNADHTVNVSTFTYTLTGASADVNVDLGADLLCDRGFTCDFGNTAKLALSLPTGTTFTSDSGVFLTAPTGGVPEPTTWALLIGGFGMVGAATRRRRPSVTA